MEIANKLFDISHNDKGCSSSPPGGNQVDGLPPAPSTPEWVFYRGRQFTTLSDFRRAVAKICNNLTLTYCYSNVWTN